ncbi:MAG: helix-turn-helix domain-containing protein [bacterium]|nr:helix-turn-helix domain-containing protein [bacterium]
MPEVQPKLYFVNEVVEKLQFLGYFELTEKKLKVWIKEGIIRPVRLNSNIKRSRYVYTEADIAELRLLCDLLMVLPKQIAVDLFRLCQAVAEFDSVLENRAFVRQLLETPVDIDAEPWSKIWPIYTAINAQAILLENAWPTIDKALHRIQLAQESFFGIKLALDNHKRMRIAETPRLIMDKLESWMCSKIAQANAIRNCS